MKAIADIVSLVATVVTLCTNVTTVYAMYLIWKQKSTTNFLLLPYVVMFISSVLWATYGAMTQTFSVEFVSCVNFVFNLIYLILYVKFTQNKPQSAYQIIGGGAGLVFFLLYFRQSVATDATAAVNELGLVCDAVTIVQFFSPLSALGEVIRTKSSNTIPLGLVSINFAVSGLWWFYGYLLEDNYIILPNMIGCFFAFVQLTLCFVYPRRVSPQSSGLLANEA